MSVAHDLESQQEALVHLLRAKRLSRIFGGCSVCMAEVPQGVSRCDRCERNATIEAQMAAARARNNVPCPTCDGTGRTQGFFCLDVCIDCAGSGDARMRINTALLAQVTCAIAKAHFKAGLMRERALAGIDHVLSQVGAPDHYEPQEPEDWDR